MIKAIMVTMMITTSPQGEVSLALPIVNYEVMEFAKCGRLAKQLDDQEELLKQAKKDASANVTEIRVTRRQCIPVRVQDMAVFMTTFSDPGNPND
ncbi:hypothetical protein [Aestuariivirga sp.]|uniref:hypothetical protein n=1 Tax=Aestuariivirga sp. TaxID=2650926 RepID=UPI0039E55616